MSKDSQWIFPHAKTVSVEHKHDEWVTVGGDHPEHTKVSSEMMLDGVVGNDDIYYIHEKRFTAFAKQWLSERGQVVVDDATYQQLRFDANPVY